MKEFFELILPAILIVFNFTMLLKSGAEIAAQSKQ